MIENRCESEEKSVEFFTETKVLCLPRATYMSVDIIETNKAANMAWKMMLFQVWNNFCNPSKTAPFIIGIIKPKETTASGRVSNKIIGFTNIFINVSNTVVINRASVVSNENPSKRALVIQREIPVAIRFVKFAIIFEGIINLTRSKLYQLLTDKL